MLRIKLTSVIVDNQAKAHKFYTEVLGFQTKRDLPAGEHRWLTLVSPADPDGVELLLEPAGPNFAKAFQRALYDAGIPFTGFAVDDVGLEYERLKARGVKFKRAPSLDQRPVNAVFDDTCGNLIQIFQARG